MRKALIYILLFFSLTLGAKAQETPVMQGRMVQMTGSFLQPLQERDSVLIADQVRYGFDLPQVEEGTLFGFPQIKDTLMTNIRIVENWRMDTLKVKKQKKGQPGLMDLRGGITITSFDEGIYYLPPLAVQRMTKDGVVDTLVFDPQKLEIKTMPVDTATFQPHDIKGQMTYPVTFKEVAPWVAGGLAAAGLIALLVWLIVRHSRRNNPEKVRSGVCAQGSGSYRGTQKTRQVPRKCDVGSREAEDILLRHYRCLERIYFRSIWNRGDGDDNS